MNSQDWFPLVLTGLISLLSKGLSRVFSNTTVQEHQFLGTQLSLWTNSHIHTWLLEKIIALTRWTFVGKIMSLLFNMLSRFTIVFFFLQKGRKFCFIPFFESSCSFCWLKMAPWLQGHWFLLAWDMGPAGVFSGEGNGNSLQYSCLENPRDGGAW